MEGHEQVALGGFLRVESAAVAVPDRPVLAHASKERNRTPG
jgi:hypothetical protein